MVFLCFVWVGQFSVYAQESNCGDGIDNDGDGLIDCYDTDCGGTPACADFYYGRPAPDCQFIPDIQADTFELELIWQTDEINYPIDQRHIPIVGDIDGDGTPEVLAMKPGTPGYIRIFNGITGAHELSITVTEGLTNFSNLAIGDVDEDGTAEIFIVNNNNNLARYEHTGANTWINTTDAVPGSKNSPALANFDGAGYPEVYVANLIFNAQTGATLVNVSTASTGGYAADESYPVAIDVFSATDIIPATGSPCGSDCDGLELVSGDTCYTVNLASLTGLEPASYVSGMSDGVTSVADFDGDGDLDAVIMDEGVVYIWDLRTGNQLFGTYTFPGTNSGGRINIADFDNDGYMEIGAAGKNLYAVLDTNVSGNLVAKWTKVVDDASQRTGSTVFDFEGDGQNEVVYSEEEYLFLLDGVTGDEIARVTSNSGTRYDYPLVADMNGDGQAEIVITSQDGNGPSFSGNNYVRAYRSKHVPWVAAREVWNQHTYLGTNVNDDLTIPLNQQNHHLVPELNGFLVQSTFRLENGEPTFGAPDAQPHVEGIDNALCGSNKLLLQLRIGNTGDWKLPAGAPVAFYLGNPRLPGSTFLDTTVTSLTVDQGESEVMTLTVEFSPGDFPADLYIIVNDSGFQNASLPLDIGNDFPVTGVGECSYYNNITHVFVDGSCSVAPDRDGDGVADNLDRDNDNDGIPDSEEDGGTGFLPAEDADGDGIPNYLDQSDVTGGFPAWADANGDGVNDSYDHDYDGIIDAFDLDSDNDGIPDLIEAGGKDQDGNGMVDCYSLNTDLSSLTDTDSDGWCDTYDNAGGAYTSGMNLNTPDTDGDGQADYLDLDADNDGIPDVIESGGLDTDGDGYPDNLGDQDRDGLVDMYDPDDDGSFGTDAGGGGDPLLLTTGDNGDGTATGYSRGDADVDGVPNFLDLDADNDGVSDLLESGGTDSNGDGKVDTFTDTDGDGFADAFDADDGGSPIISTGADTDFDNRPDDYSGDDPDSDILPSFLDIDADNDGILDNMEAQTTAGFSSPANTDSDQDGILDAYALGFLSPVDTDSDATPDYLDSDADGDGMPDRHEAWDAYDDGDSRSDLTCSADLDRDGLLDCYDSDDADASVRTVGTIPPDDNGYDGTGFLGSKSSTGTLAHELFPNNGGALSEPDWRDDDACTLSPSLYYPITGTDHIFNAGANKHNFDNATIGAIRAMDYCDGFIEAGWRYYFNPMNPEQIIFAINHGANTTLIDYIELRRDLVENRKALSGSQGFLTMSRDWFVQTLDDAALTAPVNVRFYFDPADSTAMQDAADAFILGSGGSKGTLAWFKLDDQWNGNQVSSSTGLSHLTGYSILTPDSYDSEGGLHYVQFNGISGFSGGGLILEVEGTLPVEFSHFDLQYEEPFARLEWGTHQEQNSDRFWVERSADGRSFEPVGQVRAAGTSSQFRSYTFIDKTLPAFTVQPYYYRIREVDFNGYESLSEIKTLVIPGNEHIGLKLAPNPGHNRMVFAYYNENGKPLHLKVLSISGQLYFQERLPALIGPGNGELSVEDWPNGLYILLLEGNNKTHSVIFQKE